MSGRVQKFDQVCILRQGVGLRIVKPRAGLARASGIRAFIDSDVTSPGRNRGQSEPMALASMATSETVWRM